jgi:hypothetical protein
MALTNESTAPVLTVGDKLVAKGYSESRWQAMLDEAGYPKTPAPRRAAPAVRLTEVPVAAAAPEGTKAVGPGPRGGDYPK